MIYERPQDFRFDLSIDLLDETIPSTQYSFSPAANNPNKTDYQTEDMAASDRTLRVVLIVNFFPGLIFLVTVAAIATPIMGALTVPMFFSALQGVVALWSRNGKETNKARTGALRDGGLQLCSFARSDNSLLGLPR